MAIVSLIVRRPPAPIAIRPLSLSAFTGLLVGLGLLCSAYIAVTFGVSLSLPGLASVYDTRADFRATVGGSSAAAGYIVPWAGNVINPLLMALGVARRRAELVALGLVGQLLIYSVTGFKSILFSVALVPLVYLAISVASRVFGLLAAVAAPVIFACGVIATSMWGSIWPLAITARLFATPGQVGFYYYEYFSDHPSYGLSQSFLRWAVSSPYSEDVPFVIGSAYFAEGTNANGNIWADAFANFGFAGIVCFTLVLGLFLWIADGLGQWRDARVAGPMLAIAGLSLANGAFFTTILTLGLALGCLLMALMPPPPGNPAAPKYLPQSDADPALARRWSGSGFGASVAVLVSGSAIGQVLTLAAAPSSRACTSPRSLACWRCSSRSWRSERWRSACAMRWRSRCPTTTRRPGTWCGCAS